MKERTMFKKRSSGKNLIDYTLPAEQRPWRVQFDEMHICLAALTVHLLRGQKCKYEHKKQTFCEICSFFSQARLDGLDCL